MPMELFICHCLDEWFEEPCAYTFGSTDATDIISEIDPTFCERNCGNIGAEECWKKLFECERARWGGM